MQRAQRDEVSLVAEQVAELVGELFDLPAQLAPRTECVETGTRLAACRRVERSAVPDPVGQG